LCRRSRTKFGPVVANSISKREIETEADGKVWPQELALVLPERVAFKRYVERQTPQFYWNVFDKKFSTPGCGLEKRTISNSSMLALNGGPDCRFRAFRFNYAAIVLRRFAT
jgi:hypothetical protein